MQTFDLEAQWDEEDEEIQHIDDFVVHMYNYFKGHGYSCLLWDKILNLIRQLLFITLCLFLFGFIDWSELLDCGRLNSDTTCGQRAVARGWALTPTFFILTLGFTGYWLALFISFLRDWKWMREQKKFFRSVLNLPDKALGPDMCSWSRIVELFVESEKKKKNIERTPLEIAQRLMRKENFLIALHNSDLLDCPLLGNTSMTYTLEKCIEVCVVQQRHTAPHLAQRFRFAAFLHVLFTPVILVHLCVVRLFLGQLAQFYRKPAELGVRDWSRLARWKFRDYNEPVHLFEERLERAKPAALAYIDRYPSLLSPVSARFMASLLGALLSVLLLIGVLDDSLLLQTHFFERNLVWYLGIFLAGITLCNIFTEKVPLDPPFPEKHLETIAEFTHHFPADWRRVCEIAQESSSPNSMGPEDYVFFKTAARRIQREFFSLFKLKIVSLAEELMSVFLVPYILWSVLPARAHTLTNFIETNTLVLPGLGEVCVFSIFDFEKNGNAKYGATMSTASSKMARDHRGKMAKSYLNFAEHNPRWEGTQSGHLAMQSSSLSLSKMFPPSSSLTTSRRNTFSSSHILSHFPGRHERSSAASPWRGPLGQEELNEDLGSPAMDLPPPLEDSTLLLATPFPNFS